MTSRPSAIRFPVVPIVVCLAGVVVATGMPYVGLPLCAAALAAMAFDGRALTAVLTASAAAGAVSFVGGIPAAIAVTPALAAILVAASSLRERPAVRTTAVLALVLTVGFVAADVFTARMKGMAFTAFINDSTAEAAAAASMLAGSEAIAEQVSALAEFLARTWPADYAVTGIISAVGIVTAIGWASRRTGASIQRLPRLDSFDLSPWVLVAPTAALVLLALGRMNTPAIVTTLGLNLLLIVRPLFVWQGLAVTADWVRRKNMAPLGQVLVYAVVGLAEILFLGLAMIGLIDLRANLRKIARSDEAPDEAAGPASGI